MIEQALADAGRLLTEHELPARIPLEGLRRFATGDAPDLAALADDVRGRLESDGFAKVDNLPFMTLQDPARAVFLLSLCSCLGTPTPTDPRMKTIIWPIHDRPELPEGDKSITERLGESELHSDNSWVPAPEPIVALFVVRPASDGGESRMLHTEKVLAALRGTPDGQRCEEVLRGNMLPFDVPVSFRRRAHVPEIHYAYALTDQRMRWRFDVIAKGLEAHPERDLQEVRFAINHLRATINGLVAIQTPQPASSALFIANDRLLHCRTNFSDPGRLLLRVRIRHDAILSAP